MPFGLLTGLGAAIAWGTMDIASALASRRAGSLAVTAGVVASGAVLLLVIALAGGTTLPTEPIAIVLAVLLGGIGAGAYLAYFTGLRIGPIAVVSGMVAAYGGLSVVLAVVIRGETLTTLQAFGAAIATVGVILTGVAFDGRLRGTRFAGPGVVFAVVALVLFAMMTITTDIALESAGWLEVLVVSRSVTAVVSIAALVGLRIRRSAGVGGPDEDGQARAAAVPAGRSTSHRWRIVGAILVAALLDVLGLMSFSIGLTSAPTWLVGLASSFGPTITIIVAVAFLGERLRPIQWAGLTGVAVGMIAIALP